MASSSQSPVHQPSLFTYRDMTDTLNTPVPGRVDPDDADIYPSKLPNKIENLLKFQLNATNYEINGGQPPLINSHRSMTDTIDSTNTLGKEDSSNGKEDSPNGKEDSLDYDEDAQSTQIESSHILKSNNTTPGTEVKLKDIFIHLCDLFFYF